MTETAMADHRAQNSDGKVMTVVEHLSELRRRIFIGIVAVVIGSIVGFYFAPDAIRFLKTPISQPLYFTAPSSAFFLQLKLALMMGVALASPVLLYQVWAFISPGLTPRERRLALPWVPLGILFLVIGVAVAWFVLPFAVSFMLGFAIPGVIDPLITADAYFGFVTNLFLAFGLVMEFPIVLALLSKVGIISAERLRRNRRYVFLGIFVFAVVVTPGGDPYSPAVMGAVMYLLYELTIRLVGRSDKGKATTEGTSGG
ncbi:MAG TPA: twin-arginine translocase subunit TatC [Candidatus Limnocylindria bacterium]|nr:twin-arginine translocase subunit TatC [Candidatus Limnocylindria bacterium]